MRRIDVGDFVSIRKIRHQHDDRSLAVAIDRLASGASQRARLFALRVDVARHNGRGNGIVRIEQLQRDDSSSVDRKSVVVDRGSLQAMLARRRAVRLPKRRVDAKLIRHLTEFVPVLIDQHPLRLLRDLKEMSNDGEPLRRIKQQQLRARTLDLAANRFVRLLESSPANVLLGAEQDVRLARDYVHFVYELRIEN